MDSIISQQFNSAPGYSRCPLFINCLEGVSDEGQFKNLLIRYAILEHLPIREVENGYSLAGTKEAVADDDMFLQYKEIKELGTNLVKYYGGAFGENKGIPYNLRPEVKESIKG